MKRRTPWAGLLLLCAASCDEQAPLDVDPQDSPFTADAGATRPKAVPEPIHADPDGDVDVSEIPDGPRVQLPPATAASGCQWNAVALFYNVLGPLPAGYSLTTNADAREFMDEGSSPMDPTLSESTCGYWSTLTYGQVAFGVDTQRNGSGNPIVSTISSSVDPKSRGQVGAAVVAQHPEEIWQAAGSLYRNDAGEACSPSRSRRATCHRYVPSVVLIANYDIVASASLDWNHVLQSGGHSYKFAELQIVEYSLATFTPPGGSAPTGRHVWGTMHHEWGHNFFNELDIYGPTGCTGYWDLIGDNLGAGVMSDVWSRAKVKAGYLEYEEVIEGETNGTAHYELAPYATTGEAIKVVPDPVHRPNEYFLLENRTSTGPESWLPDGALTGDDGGLLITHVKDDLILPPWLNREAPLYDPEFADFSDLGTTKWTGRDDLQGKTFPHAGANSFTASTSPSSNLYGGRASGLSITQIQKSGNNVEFDLELDFGSDPIEVGWAPQASDELVVGHFTPESLDEGAEVFAFRAGAASLLQYRQATLQAHHNHLGAIDGFPITAQSRALAGDFDGDGLDELFFRDDDNAAVLDWTGSEFEVVAEANGGIDGWNLGPNDWEAVAAFDFSGREEIVLRGANWAGVVHLAGVALELEWIDSGSLDDWDLLASDKMLVGDFYYPGLEQVAMVGPDEVGLFFKQWVSDELYHPFPVQSGGIDSWNIGSLDRHIVGDFTGDGRDDIFVRSAGWAGLWTWNNNRFETIFIQSGDLDGVALSSDDRIWAGRFSEDRDGVLMQTSGGLHIFEFDNGAFVKRVGRGLGLGNAGSLTVADEVVIGDFHPMRTEPFTNGNNDDYVMNGIDDVYVHGNAKVAVTGRDRVDWKSFDKFRLTWANNTLLYDGPPSISQ